MRMFLAFLLCLLPLAALAQEDDRGFLTRLLEENLSGAGREVRVIGFAGALSSRATVQELTIADDKGVWLTLRGVELDWSRTALLSGRVEVNRLTAREIVLDRPPETGPEAPPSPEVSSFSLPELPVAVRIGEVSAGRIDIGAAVLGQPVSATLQGAMTLEAGAGTAQMALLRLDGARGELSVRGAYSNVTRQLTLDLSLDEAADGIAATLLGLPGTPALALAVAGDGPIDSFAADIRLASDGQDRLAGQAIARALDDGARGFRLDLSGDVGPLMLPEYRAFFGNEVLLQAEGRRGGTGAVDLQALTIRTAELALEGRARLAPDGLPQMLDVRLDVEARIGSQVLLPIPGDPVRVSAARLRLTFDDAQGDGWTQSAEVLGLDQPGMTVARLSLDGSGRIARQPGGTRVVGGTLRFDAEGVAPADMGLARALGRDLRGETRFLWSAGAPLRLPDLRIAGDGYGANARLALGGEALDRRLTGTIAAMVDDLGRFSGLAGRDLGGAGQIAWDGSVAVLSGAFDGLATMTGRDIRLGQPELDGLLRGESTIGLSVARGEDGLEIRALDMQATTLRAQAQGWIRTEASDLTARLDFSDLAVLGGDYGGGLRAEATLVQEAGTDRLRLTGIADGLRLGIPELDGMLRGQTRVALQAQRRADVITIDSAEINGANLVASLRGVVADTQRDVTLRAELPRLSALGGSYGGALRAEAGYRALGGTETVALTAQASNLAVGIPEADGLLRGDTRLTLDGSRTDGVITVQDLTITGANLAVSAQGALSEVLRDLSLRVDLPRLSALGPRYGGALQAEATYRAENGSETASLTGEARDLSVGVAEADRLLRGETRLAVAGTRADGAIRLDRLRLDNAQLTAQAQAEGAPGRMRVTARLADLALFVPGIPGAVTLDGTMAEVLRGFALDLGISGPGAIAARLAGQVAGDFSTAAVRLDGSADTALANAFLGPVSLQGPVRFDVALNGPPALASVSGRVALADTRVAIANPPLAVRALAGTVDLAGGQARLDLRASPETGGNVTVSGPLSLSAPYAGDLVLGLDGVVLRDPDLYSTRAGGRITVSGPLTGGAMIAGRVRLEDTELRIPSSGLGGVAAIPDIRHRGEPAAVRRTRARAGLLGAADGTATGGGAARPYGLDLTIEAPAQVFVRGRGLDAELGGALRLTGTTAAIVPSGGLDLIRGRLDLLGKRFAFTEGSLRMEGSFMPLIRLLAMTDTDDGQAGVLIDGPADAPAIRFLSTPELPEEEVVARLLFGRALTSLSPLQAAQLASAVATLTGRGGAGVVDRLRRSFGLDDLDLTTDANGSAAVRAGKYISEKVYADVTVGSDGKSDISLNIDLSKRVKGKARASSDGSTGLGLYYEKDY